MTETQRAAMQAAHGALEIAQNNLAPSRESAIAFDDGDLWDQYQRGMDGITSALAEPDIDPSCDDKRLAEMIMSDCGHSTNHTRLLERITNRIAAHVATRTEEAAADELEACEERVVTLYEELETPYLPDITRAIRARGAS